MNFKNHLYFRQKKTAAFVKPSSGNDDVIFDAGKVCCQITVFFNFRFGSIVLSLIHTIGTVQLCNTFFYTCHYYNRNSKMYRGGVLCVKKKINMISGRLGLP